MSDEIKVGQICWVRSCNAVIMYYSPVKVTRLTRTQIEVVYPDRKRVQKFYKKNMTVVGEWKSWLLTERPDLSKRGRLSNQAMGSLDWK